MLLGSSTYSEKGIMLTPSKAHQVGGCFLRQKIDITYGLVADFSFRMTRAGADGMAFVVHHDQPHSLGGSGCHLGYGGILNR
jgi:hypothetical protein